MADGGRLNQLLRIEKSNAETILIDYLHVCLEPLVNGGELGGFGVDSVPEVIPSFLNCHRECPGVKASKRVSCETHVSNDE